MIYQNEYGDPQGQNYSQVFSNRKNRRRLTRSIDLSNKATADDFFKDDNKKWRNFKLPKMPPVNISGNKSIDYGLAKPQEKSKYSDILAAAKRMQNGRKVLLKNRQTLSPINRSR